MCRKGIGSDKMICGSEIVSGFESAPVGFNHFPCPTVQSLSGWPNLGPICSRGWTSSTVQNKLKEFINVRSEKIADNVLRQRIGIIHNAASHPALREKLFESQETLTQEWMKAYQICLDRGWADPTVDSRCVSILMQATFIGRVLDGMSNVQMDLEEWKKVLIRLFDTFFFSGGSTSK